MIPVKSWWDLRRSFGRSLPDEVNARYLATVLGISERAAANLQPNLRRVGLIDDRGVPTDRAVMWRDDTHYAEVCAAIVADVYPKELRDAAPPPDPGRDRVVSWFARTTRTGQAASSQMARLYLLLAEANLEDAASSVEASTRQARERPPRTRSAQPAKLEGVRARNLADLAAASTDNPSVHIDIQVHIDASASPGQIDQIFSSMAKHLYRRE
jgi:hypothetical protein